MKKAILSICFIVFFISLWSQCGDRYLDVIYEEIEVETVIYSDYTNFEMDIYKPVGDAATDRPVVIFAFGGGFLIGSKRTKLMVDLCTDFAQRGYVAASIDYTLADDQSVLSDSTAIFGIVAEAVADGKGAIRYFRKTHDEGNPYGIDPDQIWIGGNSAGAVLSLHLAFIDETDDLPSFVEDVILESGGFEGNRGNDGYSSKVNGVISLAGAISTLDWIDKEEEEVLILCHGDLDGIVDIDCDFPFMSSEIETVNVLCGSIPIDDRATEIGLTSYLKIFEDYDHVPWQVGLDSDSIYQVTFEFAKNSIYNHLDCNLSNTEDVEISQITIFPNPVLQEMNVSTTGSNLIESIEIFDLRGKLSKTIDAQSKELTITDLPANPGLYLIRVHASDHIYTEKIIIH